MQTSDLVGFLNDYLKADRFNDASANGLQVSGSGQSNVIATAATASLEAIDAAYEAGADTLIVHHGLFWRGADPRITGTLQARIKALLDSGIALIAYHLPLDAHPEVGNNQYLSRLIGISQPYYLEPESETQLAMGGDLDRPLRTDELAGLLCEALDTRVSVLGEAGPDLLIENAAVCSGSGSYLLDDSHEFNFQALITGDVNEQTWHAAAESGTVVFAAGHHASEQDGVRLLGELIAQRFALKHVHLHFAYEKRTLWYE